MRTLLLLIPLLGFAQFRTDLLLHVTAGAVISGTTYHVVHKVTGKKWIGRVSGIVAGCTAGYLKEYVYDASGRGNVSKQDFLYTCYGSLGIQIFIGHKKRKNKPHD